ncbi:MAG: translational GTPase TypA [Calditrichaeota bacterium]|nr:translational GTPase TypA [Calditrichota bacterium]MBT7617586.1 translational GTPase TypA [Calditrichota bacterium]MBT7789060.1 translational GTPase TypA [Calditrichota bacterium]
MKNTRENLRNVAIIAHVDHGKTTLVDGMLEQSGLFTAREKIAERALDSMDLEREKGITIMAKNTAIPFKDKIINIVDTPGHADFGGEVQRILKMVDGCLLLVDASEGPLPQTRYVLSNALANGLSVIVVINKIDRPDARIDEVLNEVLELFFDLDATEEQCNFSVVYTVAKNGTATMDINEPGTDLKLLFDLIVEKTPPPSYLEGHPLQLQITSLDYSDYLGRIGIGRVSNGILKTGETILMTDGEDHSIGTKAKVTKLFGFSGLKRVAIKEARQGDIVAIAGLEGIKLGDTLTDVETPKPLPALKIDEPSLEMMFSVNTSPFSGREGNLLTSIQIRDRLFKEIQGNPSLQVEETETSNSYKVIGRGELQMAILIETMRREGFELAIGKPTVRTRVENGQLLEPFEHVVIDCPEAYIGTVSQMLAPRKGRMLKMVNNSSGWVRLEYDIPLRGLIGLRVALIVDSRGTAIVNNVFSGWRPFTGEFDRVINGVLVADRTGRSTAYAVENIQERGVMFVSPGEEVYAGRVVGENSRMKDIWVNITKEKKLTNMRASGSEDAYHIHPPRIMSLEMALEFIEDDELVEVTPKSIRLRKKIMNEIDAKKVKRGGGVEPV